MSVDGVPATGFAYAKVRALLAYLAVEPQRSHSRAALAALLWPEQPEANARGSLSQALTTLRNALGDKHAAEPLLLADAQTVRLNPHCALKVDATELRAALAAAEAHAHRSWRTCALCAARLRQALALYQGGFLADLSVPDSADFEEWAATQRMQLLQAALNGLERLAERAAWRGATAEALADARRLVALDPLLEQSQRTLMSLLAVNGEAAAAQAQYRQLQTTLLEELGAEPEPATTALSEQIRRGDLAGLQPDLPPFVLPLPPTPVVGRAEALRAICAQVREGGGLLTITGAGGIGKTRIALAAAQELRYDFEDGVYVVELAAVNDAGLVADAVARVLGVKERPRQAIGETLRDHLRTKHLLLVLDNFEHLVEAAPFVAELLAACPALHVLATSRVPLLIHAERQFLLAPLAEAEAVQLFRDRAQAAGAALDADEASTAVFAAVCRRLDQLPLAIELIAVRARSLTPQELLRQLEQPLDALARGPRDMVARHRSLRDTIQWSYDLLEPEEQRLFRALGVFMGGFTAETAELVLGASSPVLPALEALERASLLQRQFVADQTRFRFLETIREFAQEQLVLRDEAGTVQLSHAEHYAHFAMTAYAELLRAEAPRWRAWVAAEQANLRAAFRWAMEQTHYAIALRIATGVWRFHVMNGSVQEGLAKLEAALVYREQAPPQVQCDALRAAGTLASCMNDYPRARRWLEAAVEVAWRLGDQYALQTALQKLGTALLEQGELEDARIHLEVSLSLARRGAEPALAKFPLGYLASLHRRLGDYAQAQALGEECLRINQARQDPEGTADALGILGAIVLAQGDIARARELAEAAMALHRALNHQLGLGMDYALLGDLAWAQGEYSDALPHYQQCLRHWREQGNVVSSAAVLDSVAKVLSALGEAAAAATLCGAAASIRKRAGARLVARELAANDLVARACRTALGEAEFALAWDAGRSLTLVQAIELVLQPLALAAH